jgi:hypothetical protein
MAIREFIHQTLERSLRVVEDLPRQTNRRIALSGGLWFALYFVAGFTLELTGYPPARAWRFR